MARDGAFRRIADEANHGLGRILGGVRALAVRQLPWASVSFVEPCITSSKMRGRSGPLRMSSSSADYVFGSEGTEHQRLIDQAATLMPTRSCERLGYARTAAGVRFHSDRANADIAKVISNKPPAIIHSTDPSC